MATVDFVFELEYKCVIAYHSTRYAVEMSTVK